MKWNCSCYLLFRSLAAACRLSFDASSRRKEDEERGKESVLCVSLEILFDSLSVCGEKRNVIHAMMLDKLCDI